MYNTSKKSKGYQRGSTSIRTYQDLESLDSESSDLESQEGLTSRERKEAQSYLLSSERWRGDKLSTYGDFVKVSDVYINLGDVMKIMYRNDSLYTEFLDLRAAIYENMEKANTRLVKELSKRVSETAADLMNNPKDGEVYERMQKVTMELDDVNDLMDLITRSNNDWDLD